MTLDEAIKRIKEKMACDYNISGCDTCNISSCEDRDIVIQLSEWLEELKAYKQNTDICPMCDTYCSYLADEFKDGKNSAIDEAICKVEEHKTKSYVTGITNNPFEFGACQMADDIVKILEKLKEGDVE